MEEQKNLQSNIKHSMIIPVFNEEPNLQNLYNRLVKVMDGLGKPFEIIFVDDGSSDGSFQIMKDLHRTDRRVRAIRFTRNFGQHVAITAGLEHCQGENAILMDADSQDQPEEIPKLLTKLDEGYDIVYAIPLKRQDGLFKKLTSRIYLGLLAKLTGKVINPEIGSFRVMTRRVVDYYTEFKEHNRFFGGLVAWLGFPYTFVKIEHGKRFAGKTKYSLWGMIKMATEGIVSFSDVPLRLIEYFGFVVSAISFIIGLYMLIRWFIGGIPVSGYTSVIVSLFFIGGVLMVILGVIGEYIGRIHIEVKKRPLYVIKDTIE